MAIVFVYISRILRTIEEGLPPSILVTGAKRNLAEGVQCTFTDGSVINVNVIMETSVEETYAVGAMVQAKEEAVKNKGVLRMERSVS